MYNPYDYYFKKAKKDWYKARSAFKLEEIQTKFHLITKDTKNVVDVLQDLECNIPLLSYKKSEYVILKW